MLEQFNEDQLFWIRAIRERMQPGEIYFYRKMVIKMVDELKKPMPGWLIGTSTYQVPEGHVDHERGKFWLPKENGWWAGSEEPEPVTEEEVADREVLADEAEANFKALAAAKKAEAEAHPHEHREVVVMTESFIPDLKTGYVPFGVFEEINDLITSGIFCPVYVPGNTGCGKTLAIEQACAVQRREIVRVNITEDTDEDDLLGGFRLVKGETVWHEGPVVTAMKMGAILLLDEIDLGSNKIMCLQPILEGSAVFLKKIGQVIKPAAGFTIFATANTKGQGSADGRFVGTNVMNEAFLDRFALTLEQDYPPNHIEIKILKNLFDVTKHTTTDLDAFAGYLVKWADGSRKVHKTGGAGDVISTRRLVHIVAAFNAFGGNRMRAVSMALNRFDDQTKAAFLESYQKCDPDASKLLQEAKTDADRRVNTFAVAA
jgi:hypothetical protein